MALATALAGLGAMSGEQKPWVEAAPLGDPRQELGVAAEGGILYTVGGLRENRSVAATLEAFDPETGKWRTLAPLPIEIHHPAVASLAGRVYVLGGNTNLRFQTTPRAFAYDTKTDTWAELPPLPTARGAAAAVVIGAKIYVVGGNPASRALEAYDPATGEWEALPPMPTGRNHLTAVALGGLLYVAGGRGGGDFTRGDLEVYDPATREWRPLAPMPTGRSGIASAVVGGCLLVFGGEGSQTHPQGVFPEVEAYDPALDRWFSLAPMPLPRHGIGAALIKGRVHIPGGGVKLGLGATGHHDWYEPPDGLSCGPAPPLPPDPAPLAIPG